MNTPTHLTKSEFAASQGWAKSYVSKLLNEGRLVVADVGGKELICVPESLARIAETTRAPERASAPVVSPAFQADRSRREFYDAENARLDLQERVGKLFDAADVLHTVSAAVADLGARLEALPAEAAPELAGLQGDEAAIRRALADRVHLIRAELARHFETLAEQAASRARQAATYAYTTAPEAAT